MNKKYKEYPVIGTYPLEYVPLEMLLPHEKRVYKNHNQSLEQLAKRGGLDWGEILAILEDRPWGDISADRDSNKKSVLRYVSEFLNNFEVTNNGNG